ncbi:MAG: autotransporter domain-containing protein [Sutterella sp.]|nr:autotransporter domain-containing protein [Sutterella sp.]
MQNNTIAAAMPGFGTKTILAAAVAAVISTGAFAASSSGVLITPDATELNSPVKGGEEANFEGTRAYLYAGNALAISMEGRDYGENAKVEGVKASYVQEQAADGAGTLAINALILEGGTISGLVGDPVKDAETSAVGGSALAAVYSKSEGNANALRVRVKGTDFTGNASTGQGGAVYLEGVEAAFTDSNFQNNTTSKEGGAIYAKGGQVTLAAANADVVISGNKAASKNVGGFLYAADAANVTLDAAEGRTITIGTVGESTDSLTSYTTRDSYGTLTKKGKGKVVINSSMEAWKNDVVVEAGTLEIMSGIGSYDLSVVATKGFSNNYGQTVTATGSSTLILHDVLFNSREKPVGKTCEGLSIEAADTSTVKAGTFTVGKSSYGLSGVDEQEGLGSIDVAAGASASIEKLVINSGGFQVWGSGRVTIGDVEMNGGQLELKNNTITRIDGSVTFAQGAALAYGSSATLETAWTNLIKDDLKTKTAFGEALGKALGKVKEGKIVETAYTGTYTLEQLKDANKFFFGDDNKGVFSFENATLVGDENGNVSIDKVLETGGTYGSSTLKAAASEDHAVAITAEKAISFGALEVDANTEKVTVTNTAAVTMVGAKDSGNLLEGRNVELLDFSGTLNLGADAEDVGTVNANELSADTLNVNGAYAAKTVQTKTGTVSEGASLSMGTLILKDNTSSGKMTVAGTLELAGSTALYDVVGGELTSTGLLTTNAAAAAQYADEADAVFYVDRQVTLSGAAVTVGSAAVLGKAVSMKPVTPSILSAGTAATTQSVTVKSDAALVLDTTGFVQPLPDVETYVDSDVDNTVFGKNTKVTVDGKLVLTNVTKSGVVELGKSDSAVNGTIETDSKFIKGAYGETGVVLSYASVIGNDTLDARLAARYAQGLSSKEASIIKALEANEAFFGTGVTRSGHETLTAEGLAAYAQAMGGNVTAGVLNVAYDANTQVADAIARHQLAAGNAMGVWADVFHTKNEAKKLYGKTGYEADITGGVLGFDMPVADLFKAGAAVVVGTADTDTVGGLKNSVDTDFWGVSLYAVKDFAGLNVKADLGYLDFSNDFKGTGDASDATSMTFGVRGDFTAYQSGVVTVAPHFGLRFTKIDTDAVAFNKGQDMNVLEAPIGVAVAAAFEAQGWTFRPTADVTIVPQLGDKAVESFGSASEVTVLSGGLVNTTVGVTAEQGAFVFGLNAGYGFGPSDRANTNVNASVVYRF